MTIYDIQIIFLCFLHRDLRANSEFECFVDYWEYRIRKINSMNKQGRLNTEDDGVMGKETIIFFENLGFGWVLDDVDLEQMRLGNFHDEIIVNNSLMKIIENLLSDNQRY